MHVNRLITAWEAPTVGSREWIEKLITFFAIVFPALGGAIFGLRSHRENLRLERRSANMVSRLRHLKKLISHAFDAQTFEHILGRQNQHAARGAGLAHVDTNGNDRGGIAFWATKIHRVAVNVRTFERTTAAFSHGLKSLFLMRIT
jgi:hypothetical protein